MFGILAVDTTTRPMNQIGLQTRILAERCPTRCRDVRADYGQTTRPPGQEAKTSFMSVLPEVPWEPAGASKRELKAATGALCAVKRHGCTTLARRPTQDESP